jgi:hypothetical protein
MSAVAPPALADATGFTKALRNVQATGFAARSRRVISDQQHSLCCAAS